MCSAPGSSNGSNTSASSSAGGAGASTSGRPPSSNPFNLSQLKAGLKKYGRTGLFTYLSLSTCVTASFYVAIENAVDVRAIFGMKKEDPDAEPSFLERIILGKGSNLALAIICSKMVVPIKIPAAMALTPYVQRVVDRLRPTFQSMVSSVKSS